MPTVVLKAYQMLSAFCAPWSARNQEELKNGLFDETTFIDENSSTFSGANPLVRKISLMISKVLRASSRNLSLESETNEIRIQ